MIRILRNNKWVENRQGQNAVEYLLVFMLVIIVIVAALAPNGFLTRALENTIDMSISSMEIIVNSAWP